MFAHVATCLKLYLQATCVLPEAPRHTAAACSHVPVRLAAGPTLPDVHDASQQFPSLKDCSCQCLDDSSGTVSELTRTRSQSLSTRQLFQHEQVCSPQQLQHAGHRRAFSVVNANSGLALQNAYHSPLQGCNTDQLQHLGRSNAFLSDLPQQGRQGDLDHSMAVVLAQTAAGAHSATVAPAISSNHLLHPSFIESCDTTPNSSLAQQTSCSHLLNCLPAGALDLSEDRDTSSVMQQPSSIFGSPEAVRSGSLAGTAACMHSAACGRRLQLVESQMHSGQACLFDSASPNPLSDPAASAGKCSQASDTPEGAKPVSLQLHRDVAVTFGLAASSMSSDPAAFFQQSTPRAPHAGDHSEPAHSQLQPEHAVLSGHALRLQTVRTAKDLSYATQVPARVMETDPAPVESASVWRTGTAVPSCLATELHNGSSRLEAVISSKAVPLPCDEIACTVQHDSESHPASSVASCPSSCDRYVWLWKYPVQWVDVNYCL